MRSVNEIVIAVLEMEPVTYEELRLAVIALNALEYSARGQIQTCIKALESIPNPSAVQKFILSEAIKFEERRFDSFKLPMDVYLGVENTPGTPENLERRKLAKRIFKQATGQDL